MSPTDRLAAHDAEGTRLLVHFGHLYDNRGVHGR